MARFRINASNVAPGQRGIIYISIGAGHNSVRAAAMWGIEDLHLASAWVQPAIDTILPSKPKHTIMVKGGGVQVGIWALQWQREYIHH
ncbi:MAG TPA: hypothetical protein EYM65_08025 [Dehalococcoidia bacterium]|nr:hypothetical protein [Dehalococcoidia bacterium]